MISLNPNTISDLDSKKILNGAIIPRPVAFVTSSHDNATLNGAPFSYFNIVSSTPPLIMIAVNRRDNKMKDTAINILETEEFVVHLIDEDNLGNINATAESLSIKESEVLKHGLTPVESTIVQTRGIKESKVRFECVLEKYIELENTDMFIGRVVFYHLEESIYKNGKIQLDKYNVVGRLSGSNYSTIGKIIEIERPQ
ncbi:MAG: flavin reductase family protein [Bacilli bacterium]